MISANFFFSWNSNSVTACNIWERSVNVVRRYFLNAFSARLNRFSISASSKGEKSFSFSPVAGLIDAIGIFLTKLGYENEQRWNALSSRRWVMAAALPPDLLICALDDRLTSSSEKPIHL